MATKEGKHCPGISKVTKSRNSLEKTYAFRLPSTSLCERLSFPLLFTKHETFTRRSAGKAFHFANWKLNSKTSPPFLCWPRPNRAARLASFVVTRNNPCHSWTEGSSTSSSTTTSTSQAIFFLCIPSSVQSSLHCPHDTRSSHRSFPTIFDLHSSRPSLSFVSGLHSPPSTCTTI